MNIIEHYQYLHAEVELELVNKYMTNGIEFINLTPKFCINSEKEYNHLVADLVDLFLTMNQKKIAYYLKNNNHWTKQFLNSLGHLKECHMAIFYREKIHYRKTNPTFLELLKIVQ